MSNRTYWHIFDLGELGGFHCEDWLVLSKVYSQTRVFLYIITPLIIDFIKFRIRYQTQIFISKHILPLCSIWSSINSCGNDFTDTLSILNSFIKIEWHEPIDMLRSLTISLTVSHRSLVIFFLDRHNGISFSWRWRTSSMYFVLIANLGFF